jgi:chromosome partitioning protein
MNFESGPVLEAQSSRVIVVANEKGGSGKSTVAVNIAVALMKAGHSVATLDLDTRQRSLTHYIDNRLSWARSVGRDIPTPSHTCFGEDNEFLPAGDSQKACEETIGQLAASHRFVVVDTPGHDDPHFRAAHLTADTLVTPLNDSFVDLDVLGNVDPKTFDVVGIGQYARVVEDARRTRREQQRDIDWLVLRNRLSHLNTRNKRLVGEAMNDLSRQLGSTIVDGLSERLIFREFYPRGLTAVDDLDEATLGTRPTLSHASAAIEMHNLVRRILGLTAAQPGAVANAA